MPYSFRLQIDTNADEMAKKFSKAAAKLGAQGAAMYVLRDTDARIRANVLNKWTESWQHKPNFRSAVSANKGPEGKSCQLTYWLVPNKAGRIFKWIDQGTPDREIHPKNGKYLHFRTGYVPKTQPYRAGETPKIGSGVVSKSEKSIGQSAWVKTLLVKHHIIRPRNIMQHALDEAVIYISRNLGPKVLEAWHQELP